MAESTYARRKDDQLRFQGYRGYIQPDAPLNTVARLLKEYSSSRTGMIASVFNFVTKNIEYDCPEPYRIRYPIETLVERKGHCLDKVLLGTTLLRLASVDSCVMTQDDHAVIGVSLNPGERLRRHSGKGVVWKDSVYTPVDVAGGDWFFTDFKPMEIIKNNPLGSYLW